MSNDQTATKAYNLFSIVSFETQCHLPGIQVDFTAPFNLNKASNSIVPAFCKDRNFFTPAFILPREKEYYQANSSFERTLFEQRMRKAQVQLQSPMASLPKQAILDVIAPHSNFCQICRTTFASYIDHIKEDIHLKGIQSKSVNDYILQLCENYCEKGQRGRGSPKQKTIKKRKQRKVLILKRGPAPKNQAGKSKK